LGAVQRRAPILFSVFSQPVVESSCCAASRIVWQLMKRDSLNFARGVVIIAALVLTVLAASTAIDLSASGYPLGQLNVFDYNAAHFLADLTNRGLNQALATAFTIVAIAVPLTANLYSLKFIEFFVKDRINIAVLALVVCSDLVSLWAVYSLKTNYIPRFQLDLDFGLLILSLCVLYPYLLYVFRFLHPDTLLERLESEVEGAIRAAGRRPERAAAHRHVVAQGLEHIANMAVRSIDRTDRATAIACVLTLEHVLRAYWNAKPGLPPAWFTADPASFEGFSSEAVTELTANRTWVEMIFFWQMRGILSAAVPRTHDVADAAARALRHLGMSAPARGDAAVRQLIIEYFNTFIRLALTRHDSDTAFALFDHYRLLAENLNADEPGLVLEIAYYFQYYAEIARAAGLPFLVSAISHDLGHLVQHAWETRAPNREKLLERFMAYGALNRPVLPGVVKAQAILASYFLLTGQPAAAEMIRRALASLDPALLAAIKDDLLHIRREAYWEITERRAHIDYVPDAQREKLREFLDSLS
jgi:hypothetical protein